MIPWVSSYENSHAFFRWSLWSKEFPVSLGRCHIRSGAFFCLNDHPSPALHFVLSNNVLWTFLLTENPSKKLQEYNTRWLFIFSLCFYSPPIFQASPPDTINNCLDNITAFLFFSPDKKVSAFSFRLLGSTFFVLSCKPAGQCLHYF